ncbi:MAG TPA: aldehyde dehydrogenase family protein, partial [Candidatus Dormibacteraeota bacterium]|nr:aldehyde dehydrogenase family protein [Candidatus Dormibacteraeota bacterium]
MIGGTWCPSSGGARLAVEDPSTAGVLCDVADATPDDALEALDAAVAAQPGWAAHPPRDRGEILRRAYEGVTARIEEIALLM